jgi:hypothetical protein
VGMVTGTDERQAGLLERDGQALIAQHRRQGAGRSRVGLFARERRRSARGTSPARTAPGRPHSLARSAGDMSAAGRSKIAPVRSSASAANPEHVIVPSLPNTIRLPVSKENRCDPAIHHPHVGWWLSMCSAYTRNTEHDDA